MAKYRMYFVDRSGRFRWPFDLSAKGDGDALSVAHAAQYVCSDVPVAVELWDGARRIPGTSDRRMQLSREYWDRACSAQPEVLLRLTEALRNSGTTVARSRRLSEQMNALRSRQSASAQL
jgi:hypothetical protein